MLKEVVIATGCDRKATIRAQQELARPLMVSPR